jgi:LPXTG-site transpeptidase (sortase) family protein
MALIRRPAAVALAAGLMVIAAGTAGLVLTRHSTPPMRPPPLGMFAVPAPAGAVVAPQPLAQGIPAAPPVSLTIPLIGVKTRLVTLGRSRGGAMQVPSSTAVAGWYKGSPRPGAIGSAVIAGHIDSLSGPGVFYRLSELRIGDRVYVRRADGTTVEFQVTAVRSYLKDHFPTQAVFGPSPYAQLRLITCGGDFNFATGHYLSNTVVYATELGWIL